MIDLRLSKVIPGFIIRMILVAQLLVLQGCGDDKKGGNITGPPPTYSGVYAVTTHSFVTTCNTEPYAIDGDYSIYISGSEFSMDNGYYTGSWVEESAHAYGESEHEFSQISPDCAHEMYESAELTFSSLNSFTGKIKFHSIVIGNCGNATSCFTTWIISGVRKS